DTNRPESLHGPSPSHRSQKTRATTISPGPSEYERTRRFLMDRDLDPVEVRVLGCLIEKQRTTPDQYPLSLNGLGNACNQTTNRDPVVAYDEEMLRHALNKLGRRRYTRLASGHGSRAAKYRHLLDEAMNVDAGDIAILAVLFLRGDQTP